MSEHVTAPTEEDVLAAVKVLRAAALADFAALTFTERDGLHKESFVQGYGVCACRFVEIERTLLTGPSPS